METVPTKGSVCRIRDTYGRIILCNSQAQMHFTFPTLIDSFLSPAERTMCSSLSHIQKFDGCRDWTPPTLKTDFQYRFRSCNRTSTFWTTVVRSLISWLYPLPHVFSIVDHFLDEKEHKICLGFNWIAGVCQIVCIYVYYAIFPGLSEWLWRPVSAIRGTKT